MIEAQTNRVELPEENCETFDFFIDYIYDSKVDFPSIDERGTDASAVDAMKVCVLAEKFCMPDWQNQVINHLMDLWQEYLISPESVSWMLDNVSESTPLFRLVMNQFSHHIAYYYEEFLHGSGEEEEQQHKRSLDALCTREGFSATHLLRVSLRLSKKDNPRKTDPIRQRCKYHAHPSGKMCQESVPLGYNSFRKTKRDSR